MSLMLKVRNWEKDYEEDIASGIGFLITNPVAMNNKNQKNIDGIYSPLYEAEITDDCDISEKYRCKCKKITGRFYEGNICPDCQMPVIYIDDAIYKTGWITLNYNLIQPLMYFHIARLVGQKNLNNIIKFSKEIDIDGHIVETKNIKANNLYDNIGIIEFEKKFDEIMEHFKKISNKEDKNEIYDFIMNHRDSIFISKIPVFSLILRPVMVIKQVLHYSEINKKFALLANNASLLNKVKTEIDRNELKIQPVLYNSQLILNEIHEYGMDMIISKKGHIRNNILGVRVNFSARCVIIPLNGRYKINELVLPYLCFLEIYKYEIINLLCKMEGCTLDKAQERWNVASQGFDRKVYMIMKKLVHTAKDGVHVLINRNPTLNYGSILLCRVVDAKSDYDDLTMGIHVQLLRLLAGDFDGDVINIVCVKGSETAKIYDTIFNPINMCVDKTNRYFNRKLNLVKDQLIGLEAFCAD